MLYTHVPNKSQYQPLIGHSHASDQTNYHNQKPRRWRHYYFFKLSVRAILSHISAAAGWHRGTSLANVKDHIRQVAKKLTQLAPTA